MFFCEQKNQKTSSIAVRRAGARRPPPVPSAHVMKFFGSFFQKRTPSFLSSRRHQPRAFVLGQGARPMI
jgi:hypothetical protein